MKWTLIAGLLLAAAISIWNVISFGLENLLTPTSQMTDFALAGSIGEILILVIGALVLTWRGKNTTRWLLLAILFTLTAGFAPRILGVVEKQMAQSLRLQEERQIEMQLLHDVEARWRDVEARISAQRPYSPAEALGLVELVGTSDLSYRSLPDHSNVTLVVLRRALDGKIIDPNGLVKGPRPIDVSSEPLFLYFYRATVRPSPQIRIRVRDWEVLQLLVANGADLTVPGAAALAEDLRKTSTPDSDNRYMRLN